MVTREEIQKLKDRKLSISRIPEKTKEEFVNFANEEFCGDFGMALKYIWDTFKSAKMAYENFDFKLDQILTNQQNQQSPSSSDTEDSGIKTMSGKRLKK